MTDTLVAEPKPAKRVPVAQLRKVATALMEQYTIERHACVRLVDQLTEHKVAMATIVNRLDTYFYWANRRPITSKSLDCAQVCLDMFLSESSQMSDHIQAVNTLVVNANTTSCGAVTSVDELVEELRWIEREFGNLTVTSEVVKVTTEPIVLMDYGFGPFVIELPYAREGFDIFTHHGRLVATPTEYHPCQKDVAVPHPHVRKGEICLGDGQDAIDEAFSSGRICEAMMMARAILRTYNPKNAYYQVEEWLEENLEACYSCGSECGEDECGSCHQCDSTFCNACLDMCSACKNYFCSTHAVKCDGCDRFFCNRCSDITECSTCDQFSCSECVHECASCHDSVCSNHYCGPCASCDAELCNDCAHLCGDAYCCSGCADECVDCRKSCISPDLNIDCRCCDCAALHEEKDNEAKDELEDQEKEEVKNDV